MIGVHMRTYRRYENLEQLVPEWNWPKLIVALSSNRED